MIVLFNPFLSISFFSYPPYTNFTGGRCLTIIGTEGNVKHDTEIRLSLEDIGLRDVYLNVRVLIDPFLEEEW